MHVLLILLLNVIEHIHGGTSFRAAAFSETHFKLSSVVGGSTAGRTIVRCIFVQYLLRILFEYERINILAHF